MTGSVRYEISNDIATIQIDDGKRNALSPAVIDGVYEAFDRAEADRAIVVLTGRESVFSAGFDLNVMKRGGTRALKMLRRGYGLTARVLAYPRPVVAACNGHSYAMGVFLMLSTDYVVGSQGDFNISANEVAIGLTMPRVAAAMLNHRLSPAAYQRAVTLSETFDPDAAVRAGIFDELASPDEVVDTALERADAAKALDPAAHRASKRRIRASLIRKIRVGGGGSHSVKDMRNLLVEPEQNRS